MQRTVWMTSTLWALGGCVSGPDDSGRVQNAVEAPLPSGDDQCQEAGRLCYASFPVHHDVCDDLVEGCESDRDWHRTYACCDGSADGVPIARGATWCGDPPPPIGTLPDPDTCVSIEYAGWSFPCIDESVCPDFTDEELLDDDTSE